MDKPNLINLHGAEIRYSFDGTEATAKRGDVGKSFASKANERPNAQEQAIAWAKELQKADDAASAEKRQKRIQDRVDAAKAKRAEQREAKQPKPKTKPAANEGTETP